MDYNFGLNCREIFCSTLKAGPTLRAKNWELYFEKAIIDKVWKAGKLHSKKLEDG